LNCEATKYIKKFWNISFEAYKNIPITSIIFTYGFRVGVIKNPSNILEKVTTNYQFYYNNNLPIAMLAKQLKNMV